MRLSGAALFSLGLAALAGYAVYAAWQWPAKAALFPLTMAIPLLVLATVQSVLDLQAPASPPSSPVTGLRKELAVFAWMVGFIVLVLLVGFPATVPLFVFLYLAIASREGWLLSAVLAAAAWGFFHLLFERLLHFPFEAGWITSWFQ